MKTFPDKELRINKQNSGNTSKKIISNLFGNRFHSDETLYEYMIEFLLIFSSSKRKQEDYKMLSFHDFLSDNPDSDIFCFQPKMGLRRFIFYDKAKKSDSILDDKQAYDALKNALEQRMINTDNPEEIVDALHDLLYGYAVVLRKRAWCAQNVLPLCPEMIFCAANPSINDRKKHPIKDAYSMIEVDKYFNFNKRNFLSRGGELYYLHILQGLNGNQEKTMLLEKLLRNMITNKKLSHLINFICDTWYEISEADEQELEVTLELGFIPENGYLDCEKYAVSEMINFLSSDLHPIKRLEICARGIMFQIMRMMSWRVSDYLEKAPHRWLISMRNCDSQVVKKLAGYDFTDIEDEFQEAINKMAKELEIPEDKFIKEIHEAKGNSFDIFKSKGKEMQCIIPPKGANERFSLSEEITTFLVLSIIPPKGKMTFSSFLEQLYEHYRIVIGPTEFKKSLVNNDDIRLANAFEENMNAFQDLLRATGFLRELSDATSIVENPYGKVDLEDTL